MGKDIPEGYLLSGVKCGLKRDDYDLALISCETAAKAAIVYTTNRVTAAPIRLCKKHEKNTIRAVVINSKIANALTGKRGDRTAIETAEYAARLLNASAEQILVASTGVIGEQLPIDNIKRGIDRAIDCLEPNENNASYAILTTDTFSKKAARQIKIDSKPVKIFAMAKGAGMIHPNMATMLCFILTDANISKPVQKRMLKDVCDKTFNRISVDGDTSTNDMVLFLQNGESNTPMIREGTKAYTDFVRALTDMCEDLASLIIKDGEGATKSISVTVKKAKDENAARSIAETIACSSLVKTAFYGEDPNWGRIIAAAGRAEHGHFDQDKAKLSINGIPVFNKGEIVAYNESSLQSTMKKHVQRIELICGYKESYEWTYYFSDLTHDYVSVNSKYRS